MTVRVLPLAAPRASGGAVSRQNLLARKVVSGHMRETRTSIRGWARAAGIPPSTALKAAREGRVTVGADGKVVPSVANRQFLGRTRIRVDSPRPQGADARAWAQYRAARTRREWARAELVRLAVEEREAGLVDRAEAVAAWTAACERMVRVLMALPARVGPQVAAMTEAADIMRLLEREVRATCDALSGWDEGHTARPGGAS